VLRYTTVRGWRLHAAGYTQDHFSKGTLAALRADFEDFVRQCASAAEAVATDDNPFPWDEVLANPEKFGSDAYRVRARLAFNFSSWDEALSGALTACAEANPTPSWRLKIVDGLIFHDEP